MIMVTEFIEEKSHFKKNHLQLVLSENSLTPSPLLLPTTPPLTLSFFIH